MTTSRWNSWRKSSASRTHLRHGLRVFAVDVEDRDLQHLGHVGGVDAGAAFRRDWS